MYAGFPTGHKAPPREPSERDIDLENMLGNLMVAKYQVSRLETMIVEHMESTQSHSKFMFKRKDSWYNVYIYVDKQLTEEEEKKELEKAAEEQQKELDAEEGFNALGDPDVQAPQP